MKQSRKHRILTVLLIGITLIFLLPGTAYAADPSQEYIDKMYARVFYWYVLIRNCVAFPLLGISYAYCGFCFFFSGFLAKGEFTMDGIKSRFAKSTIALLVLLLIPYLFSWAQRIVSPNAWRPPTGDGVLMDSDVGINWDDYNFLLPEEPKQSEKEAPLEIDAGAYTERYKSAATGDYLDYWAFIPEKATENMPLVVFLHGDGEVGDMEGLKNNLIYKNAVNCYGDEFPFILIAPCTREKSWISGSIPNTLEDLINKAQDIYNTDTSKTIIFGTSRGATGAWYATEFFDEVRFSAAIIVSCPPPGNWKAHLTSPTGGFSLKIPIRAYCGNVGSDEQSYATKMQDAVEEIEELGGNATLTIKSGYSHTTISNVVYTKDLFEWALSRIAQS